MNLFFDSGKNISNVSTAFVLALNFLEKNATTTNLLLSTLDLFRFKPSRNRLLETLHGVRIALHFRISTAHIVQGLPANFCRPNEHGLMICFDTLWGTLQDNNMRSHGR